MFEEILNERQSRIDRLQVFALIGLMLVGVAFVYSATAADQSEGAAPLFRQAWFRQVVWYALGSAAAVVVCLIDYHTLARWAGIVYAASILTLIAVLIPHVGATHGWGAMRWVDLGPFQFQPSEFAKLACILAMANYVSRPVEELKQPRVFWSAIGMIALPFALILKEPDLGSALILMPIGAALLFIAGTPVSYLAKLVGAGSVVIILLLADVLFAPPGWYTVKLEDYQKQRLMVYFGMNFAPRNATAEQKLKARQLQDQKSYQVRQAQISVGSGGFGGKGWRHGSQTALGFLPPGAAHNDFIFSVIAEEEGFVGSVTVITLYSVVLFTGIRIAGQARDRLGKLLAVGAVTLLFSHVFINIGMNIRLMPVTGIPLPLLSYGGSSVICSLIAAGVLQNVYIHRKGY
jgi:rod shape determining protein RodA